MTPFNGYAIFSFVSNEFFKRKSAKFYNKRWRRSFPIEPTVPIMLARGKTARNPVLLMI